MAFDQAQTLPLELQISKVQVFESTAGITREWLLRIRSICDLRTVPTSTSPPVDAIPLSIPEGWELPAPDTFAR